MDIKVNKHKPGNVRRTHSF